VSTRNVEISMVLMQKNVVKGRKIWYNKGAYKCKKTTGIGVPMVSYISS